MILKDLQENWGEWAAWVLVALAVIHLVRTWFFNKKPSACCKKGCALPTPPPDKK